MAENDIDPTRPTTQPADEIAVPLQRAGAALRQQSQADLNARVPTPQYSKEGKRTYDTAPRQLRRLFGSPLAQTGKYAQGPNKERLIIGGWGDARNFSYDPKVNTNSRHQGLDYPAPMRELLYASGDGRVTFVGYQSKKGGVPVPGVRTDAKGNIVNGKGDIVATPGEVGFGGIIIFIVHNGDFENYRTEFMHMDEITVRQGDRVTEGQVVGHVGKTGVPGIGSHLHLQISYVAGKTSALVNPAALIPNYWPKHMDSTNSEIARGIILPPLATAGMQVAMSQAANTVNAMNRSTTMQNQDVATIRQNQAAHTSRMAQTVDVQQSAMYAAAAGFEGKAAIVLAPMTFDFATGTWNDGKPT